MVINLLTVLYYNPTFDKECPTWCYISFAVGLFLYQTFDACDGQQARRTGQSGPLGELFDHCVDACNTTLEVIIFASTTNLGYGWAVIVAQFATLFNFYLTTWEEYHTGILFLSSFSGPVEGILMIIVFYLVTAYTGPWFWHQSICDIIRVDTNALPLPKLITDVTLNDMYLAFAGIGLLFNIVQSSQNVFAARRKQGLPLMPALVQTLPFFVFFASVFGWIYIEPKILHYHLLPLMITIGAIFAFTVGRIILAHVTKQDFPYCNPLLFLPSIGLLAKFIGSYFQWDEEQTGISIIWAGLGLSVGIYGAFIAEIVTEITEYLDIWCLSIKYPQDDEKKTQ